MLRKLFGPAKKRSSLPVTWDGSMGGKMLSLLGALVLAAGMSLPAGPAQAKTEAVSSLGHADSGWVTMPAGARSAYMGIHGGTVPVSLLTTHEGTSLVTFVGSTGNDFLNLLRKADTHVPSLLNGTEARDSNGKLFDKLLRHRSIPRLLAGSERSTLPVFNMTGESFSRLGCDLSALMPFGFSDSPLSIEGEIARPDPFSHSPRYHILVESDFLHPRFH